MGACEAKAPSDCAWPNVCVRGSACLSRKAGSPPVTSELSPPKMMRQKAVFQVTLVVGMSGLLHFSFSFLLKQSLSM